MKREVNLYSARLSASVRPFGLDSARSLRGAPRFPNYGWLAMIILTIAALSYSVYTRAREQEREARDSYNETSAQVENAKNMNRRIGDKTNRIKQNPEAAAKAAQRQTRMVGPNEVVVSLR